MSHTYLVAASDAPLGTKRRADYHCTGTADDVEINAALDALTSDGGRVELSVGTFNIAAPITLPDRGELVGDGTQFVSVVWAISLSLLSADAQTRANIKASSPEFVGEIWLGEVSELVI